MRASARAARHMRMLDPNDGSLARPSPARILFGDETFIRSLFSRAASEDDDTNGEQTRRCDPGAKAHFTNNKTDAGTLGHKVFLIGMRNS